MEELVSERAERRRQAIQERAVLTTEGYDEIDLKKETYERSLLPSEFTFLTFKTMRNPSLLGIFLSFVNENLLNDIISNIDPARLIMRIHPWWKIKLTHSKILIALAVSIRVIGLQIHPSNVSPGYRHLREACIEASKHFISIRLLLFGYNGKRALKSNWGEIHWRDAAESFHKIFQKFASES